MWAWGRVVPESTSVTIGGAITGSGNVNYDDGAAVLGMVGYLHGGGPEHQDIDAAVTLPYQDLAKPSSLTL